MERFLISCTIVAILFSGLCFAQGAPVDLEQIGSWETFGHLLMVANPAGSHSTFDNCYNLYTMDIVTDNIQVYLTYSAYPNGDVHTVTNDSWKLRFDALFGDTVYGCHYGIETNLVELHRPFYNTQSTDGIFWVRSILPFTGPAITTVTLCYGVQEWELGYVHVISPDFNGDGDVDSDDTQIFMSKFQAGYDVEADFVYDGILDLSDIVYFMGTLGSGCSP